MALCDALARLPRAVRNAEPAPKLETIWERDYSAYGRRKLNMAAWTRRCTSLYGLICHSDAGSEYTSIAYTYRHDEIGAVPAVATVGDSFDCDCGIGRRALQDPATPRACRSRPQRWPLAHSRRPRDRHPRVGHLVNYERVHGELDERIPAEVEDQYGHRSQPEAG